MTDVDPQIWDLSFTVSVSQRYYARRRAFFQSLHRLATLVSAFSGTGAFLALIAEKPAIALGATLVVAIASITDLTFRFADLASRDNELYRRFSDLAVAISRVKNASVTTAQKLRTERLEIAKDEPARLGTIEAKSFNEEVVSRGVERRYLRKVRWYQVPLAQIITLPPDNFPPLDE